MDTLKTLLNHKTIRRYTPRNISEDTLQQILEAATRGSTTGNMQLYSILVTRDQEMKEKLAPFHFNQAMATSAPVILTFCADSNRFSKWCQFRNAEPGYDNMQVFMWGVIDAIIAAQNACIAAEALGLGICWLGTITFNAQNFIEILKLPKLVVPVACITLGYPDETPELTDRLPVEAVIHSETYFDYDLDRINTLYKIKENLESTKRLLEENQLPNLAQIFTEKRYKKADNEFFSEKFMEVLKNQGFLM